VIIITHFLLLPITPLTVGCDMPKIKEIKGGCGSTTLHILHPFL